MRLQDIVWRSWDSVRIVGPREIGQKFFFIEAVLSLFYETFALAFMAFTLLYMPCVVTAVAFKQEFGTWKWFGLASAYGLVLAWLVAQIIYQGGKLLGFGG